MTQCSVNDPEVAFVALYEAVLRVPRGAPGVNGEMVKAMVINTLEHFLLAYDLHRSGVVGCAFVDTAVGRAQLLWYLERRARIPVYRLFEQLVADRPDIDVAEFRAPTEVWYLRGAGAEGFNYLALFKNAFHDRARAELGRYPTLLQILLLPAEWFTDNFMEVDAFVNGKQVSLGLAMVGVARSWPAAPQYSLCSAIRGFAALVPETLIFIAQAEDVGEGRQWHVVGGPVEAAHADGYCYLAFFPRNLHGWLRKVYGAWPTFKSLLDIERKKFLPAKILSQLMLVAEGYEEVQVSAFDALCTLAVRIPVTIERSFAWQCQRDGWFLYDESKPVERHLDDRIGGGGPLKLPIVSHTKHYLKVRKEPKAVMGAEVAERIFDNAVRGWQYEGVERDLLVAIAHALVRSSHDGAVSALTFECGGRIYSGDVLVKCASEYVKTGNAVRQWVRGFRSALLAEMIFDELSDVRNVHLRNVATLASGMTKFIPLAFDLVKLLRHTRKYLPPIMIAGIRASRAIKFKFLAALGRRLGGSSISRS